MSVSIESPVDVDPLQHRNEGNAFTKRVLKNSGEFLSCAKTQPWSPELCSFREVPEVSQRQFFLLDVRLAELLRHVTALLP